MWPDSNVFDADHRIRLDLSGSDLPLMTPNPNPAIDTVLHDAQHRSYLQLSIVGADPADSVARPVPSMGETPPSQPTSNNRPAAAPQSSSSQASSQRTLASTGFPVELSVLASLLVGSSVAVGRWRKRPA